MTPAEKPEKRQQTELARLSHEPAGVLKVIGLRWDFERGQHGLHGTGDPARFGESSVEIDGFRVFLRAPLVPAS